MEPISHNEYGGLEFPYDFSHESMDVFLDSLNSDLSRINSTNNNMASPVNTPSPIIHIPTNSFYTLKSTPVSTPMTIHEGVVASSTSPSYKNKMSRTQLKQELMRIKTAEEERRESEQRRLQQGRLNQTAAVPLNASPIHLSTASDSPAAVPTTVLPPQVLKVSNLLENPTQYHYRETQQRQVRQFLNSNGAVSGSVPPRVGDGSSFLRSGTQPQQRFQQQLIGHQAVSAPANIELSSSYDLVSASSPGAYSSLVSSVTSVGSITEVGPDIINTILDLEDDASDLTEGIQTLNCTESRDSGRRQTTGPSSGSKFSFEDPTRLAKERQKKDNHNQIERKRRFNINDRITELGKMLPKDGELYHKEVGEFRHHKGNILKATVDFIKLLRKENDQLHSDQNKIDAENKGLLLKIKDYEKLLREHNIVPESKLTWQRLGSVNGLEQLLGSPPTVEVKKEHTESETPEHSLVDIMEDDVLLRMDAANDPMMPQGFLPEQRMDFF